MSATDVVPEGNRPRRAILVASETARQGRERLSVLSDAGFELVERYDLIQSTDQDELIAALAGKWAVIAGSQPITSRVLASSPELSVIARTGIGYDKIDVMAATDLGIPVLTTPGTSTESVADFTIALILACLRRIAVNDAAVRSGRWRDGNSVGSDLFGATVGIVGIGHIGKAVARRLRGFDCGLLASEPVPDLEFCRSLDIELLPLVSILPQVDVLTLHVPLTPDTRHLIGRMELAQMPRTSILINTSRGPVVDQEALLETLEAGSLAGAGLDVFEREPLPRDHPLTRLPNVVLAPHSGSLSRGAVEQTVDAVVAGLLNHAAGLVPVGMVNPDVRVSTDRRDCGHHSKSTVNYLRQT